MRWGQTVLLYVALLMFAAPSFTFAQVVINEVMYNPQGSDTGREWVELYNQGGTDVTMVGGSGKGSWRINDGSNHTLTDPAGGTGRGSLTVPAGGYLVIASDPTDFISGEYAGGSYSAVKSSISLNNSGATITLLDGTGATVDTVAYAPAQGGNDDGTSLQRQSDGSWIAALPTPGATNSIVPYVAPPETSDSDGSSQTTITSSTSSTANTPQSSVGSSYVAPPAPSLYTDSGGDRTVIVGADVEFDANAYDKDQNVLDPTTVRFLWNFGDGSTAEGDAVLHHFSYPGRYAVTLDVAANKNAASDQITVTAQPAALSFSLLQGGGVEIENLAGHDLDLSGWIVRENEGTFSAQFMLPEHSEILSDSSMNISSQTLSFRASSSTVLDYPNGAPALVIGENSGATSSQSAPSDHTAPVVALTPQKPAAVSPPALPHVSGNSSQADLSDSDTDTPDDVTDSASSSQVIPTSTILQTAAASSAPTSKYLWWIGLAGLALAAGAAIAAAAHFKRYEWDIVEHSDD